MRERSVSGMDEALWGVREGLPECSLCAHAEILQDEPDADFIIGIREPEGAGGETANEIAGEHSGWRAVAGWHWCTDVGGTGIPLFPRNVRLMSDGLIRMDILG